MPAFPGSDRLSGGGKMRGTLRTLLSEDLPKSRLLATFLIVAILILAARPFVLRGCKALSVAAKVLIFAVLVASFDLLLG